MPVGTLAVYVLGAIVSAAPSAAGQLRIDLDPSAQVVLGSVTDAGRLIAVAFGRTGDIYTLDDETNYLTQYNSRGSRLSRAGGGGRLAGDLAEPIGVSVGSDGGVQVVDARLGKLVRFRATATGLHFERSDSIGVVGNAFCELGDQAFVLGRRERNPMREDSLIHEFSTRGNFVRSFGQPFGEEVPFGQIAFGFGYTLCNASAGEVIVVSRLFPEVRAYRPNGSLLWSRRLAPFHGARLIVDSPTQVRFGVSPTGFIDENASAFFASDSVLAVQIGTRKQSVRGPTEYSPLRTELVDVRTGNLLGHQSDLPLVLGAGEAKLAVRGDAGSTWVAIRAYHLDKQRPEP
jgi:hypothetical protein